MRRMTTVIVMGIAFLIVSGAARADDTETNIGKFGLTFEGIPVGQQIGDYYLHDLGIDFTNGMIANGDWGPDCYNGGGGPCAAELIADRVTMDVYPGFQKALAFYYNESSGDTEIRIYSGLDDTGKLLADGYVPPGGGPPGDWAVWGLGFDGTAHSVEFSGGAGIEFQV